MDARTDGRANGAVAAISDDGLLGDCHGAALVSRDGSVDWWCPPRFDAPGIFGRLLDPDAGHWSVHPAGPYSADRRCLEDTMVVETGFRCGTGVPRVTDGLLLGPGERGHAIGYASQHVLVRQLQVLHGEVELELVPRLEYGLITPMVAPTAAGVDIIGGADRLVRRRRGPAGHRRGVAVVGRRPPRLPRPLPGAGAPQRFFDRITSSAGPGDGRPLQLMFGVVGEHDLTGHTLGHLAGYAGNRPVRIGNDAWSQKQLDVLGEVLECAWILREQLGRLSPTTAGFLASVADRAADTWMEPDAGIWEGREGERDYLTSKLMCWVALDRAVKLAARMRAPGENVRRWESVREEIRTAILERGWNDSASAFTGAFVICSYWLATARAMAGQVDRAREIFDAVTGHANDLGLMSEEIDIRERVLTGNFPRESVDVRCLAARGTHTVCPWKGTARYVTLEVDGRRHVDAAWFYPEPKARAAHLEDRVAFYRDVVTIEE